MIVGGVNYFVEGDVLFCINISIDDINIGRKEKDGKENQGM